MSDENAGYLCGSKENAGKCATCAPWCRGRREFDRRTPKWNPEGGIDFEDEHSDKQFWFPQADAILAAGFRRPAQTKPTDAQVERAARSIAEWNTSDVPHELCRAVARDALRAAFTAGQEDKP